MADKNAEYATIDEYIALFPPERQEIMRELRRVIRQAAPRASEKISWRMPTFVLAGNLVHFAAAKNRLGFYPGASGVQNFAHRLAGYRASKGAIQFPFSQPIPYGLVAEIVRFRAEENLRGDTP